MRFVKYYAGNVAAVGAAGRGIGTGLAVGTGVAPAFPPAGQLSTASATNLPRFACQTTIAAQSIRRMPCGQQIVKPAYSCLTIKNQIHYRIAALPTRRHQISTLFEHRLHLINFA